MGSIFEESLRYHMVWNGKLNVETKVSIKCRDDLSLAYTPGVAEPCRAIKENPEKVFSLTGKNNYVAVVSDGTAVLGLGNIGPLAGLPVMEGKCVLFKEFADINAFPICMQVSNQEDPDPEEIIKFVKQLSPSFGGINLEDLSAPHCIIVEEALQDIGIPVFHDDQHGTAIVVGAAMLNAVKAVHKDISKMKIVISGTGAAGSAIIKMLHNIGATNILAFNINGIITKEDFDSYNFLDKRLSEITNPYSQRLTLEEALVNADAFIGVSAPNLLSKEMVKSMAEDAIVMALANPNPEIGYYDAIDAGAKIVATGRSDFPNQVNNVLAFPGVFRGALDGKATRITEGMKMAAANAIASLITQKELSKGIVIPSVFDERVVERVASAVKEAAKIEGVVRSS